MAIKIMLLTQWFDPEPTFKGIVFARELVKQGFEVEVVTGFPNYPEGKLYPGYKIRLIQREVIDGVQITRLPLYPNHSRSKFKRIINYVSFGLSSLIYGLFKAKRPDVIYAYHPPLTVGFTAIVLRFIRRVPVLYDIQDMWPDTLATTSMLTNKKLLRVVGCICSWVYHAVDRIVVLSPGFKRLLIERGVSADKIQIIYNWCDADTLIADSLTRQITIKPECNHQFCVLFAGNMGLAQGLDAVIDAAEKLLLLRPEICFVFLGTGIAAEQIKLHIEKRRLMNVRCLPPVPMNEVGAYLKAADALLVHLKDDPLFRITIPSKTQAYMAIGKPIIMAVRGDAADLVEKAACGVLAIPEERDSIVEAVLRLADMSELERNNMGARGRAFYIANLAFPIGVQQFSDQFRLLLQRDVGNKKHTAIL